jgi:hypothetical protein
MPVALGPLARAAPRTTIPLPPLRRLVTSLITMPVVARAITMPWPALSAETVSAIAALTTYRCMTSPSTMLFLIVEPEMSTPFALETNRPNALPSKVECSTFADT